MDELESSVSSGQTEPGSGSREQLYPKILVSYLANPSEETTSESSQIKEQDETIKLLNEQVTMLSAKALNQLSRPLQKNSLISGKSFYTIYIITLRKLKYFMSHIMKFD